MKPPAPLLVDVMAVNQWLMAQLGAHTHLLALRICQVALALLEALGTLFSQWSANVYLDGIDHFVKRTLKIRPYLRYMDDFTLFADQRPVLEDARDAIATWLAVERGLSLNPRRLKVRPTTVPCTWLGYRTSRAGLTPGRKMRRRMTRKINAAAEKGEDALARSLAATAAVVSFG